jgi:RND family efflux transporter MFP subunit
MLDSMNNQLPEQRVAAPRKRRGRGVGVTVLVALIAAGGYAAWHFTHQGGVSQAPQQAAMAAPPVTVSAPLQREVADWTRFTGQFSAIDQVDLRAQVSGYLTEIHFTDGQIVHKGDLLFVIDPRPFEIQLQQATAQYQTAQASLELANQQLQRTSALQRSDFAPKDLLDQRVQAQRSAQAAIETAQAAIRAAQLNLEFSRITAPFTGRIGAHQLSVGNLVQGGSGAGNTLLATIVSLDPIHLDFDMSESDYLAWRRYQEAQKAHGMPDIKVEASLSDEQGWTRQGVLDFVDNQLDRSSGTMHARATIPNPDLLIAPGQFARVRLQTAAPRTVFMLPDAAVLTDQSNKVVMTVAPDGTVVPKLVKTGPVTDGLRIVTAGLTKDDRVVINGIVRARPGGKVTPQPGTIAVASSN